MSLPQVASAVSSTNWIRSSSEVTSLRVLAGSRSVTKGDSYPRTRDVDAVDDDDDDDDDEEKRRRRKRRLYAASDASV